MCLASAQARRAAGCHRRPLNCKAKHPIIHIDSHTDRERKRQPNAKTPITTDEVSAVARVTPHSNDHRKGDTPLRMGFMLDVTGYGSRTTRAKERVQERLAALIHQVLDDLDIQPLATDQQGTGDGALMFLPSELDVQHALPVLLHSTAAHLAIDNKEFQDQLQLRMAVDIGPVKSTHLGFSGATATNLGRLLNSKPPREWLINHPNHNLAVIISDRLHSFVVAEDVPRLPPEHFHRVFVQNKELATMAWLWTRDDPGTPLTASPDATTFPAPEGNQAADISPGP